MSEQTYPTNAGQCEKCGYYKTWAFRVQNSKTGKMMPGHVTAEGVKVGDGNCPAWTQLAKTKQDPTAQAPNGIQAPDHSTRSIAGGPGPNPGKATGVATTTTSTVGSKPLTEAAFFQGIEQLIREMQLMKKELLAALKPSAVYDEEDGGPV